jgi:hypothetical protein
MRPKTISYRQFGDSGPLTVYWHDGPYGAAREADVGKGVGWFAPTGDLLGVEFDDIAFSSDEQTLVFGLTRVTVVMRSGRAGVRFVRLKRGPRHHAAA